MIAKKVKFPKLKESDKIECPECKKKVWWLGYDDEDKGMCVDCLKARGKESAGIVDSLLTPPRS